MGTAQIQKDIRSIMKELNWSFRTLADVLCEELFCEGSDGSDGVNSDRQKKFCATVKKQLTRPFKNKKRLEQYLCIIIDHPDYQALKPTQMLASYVKHPCLEDDFIGEILKISDRLNDHLRQKSDS